MQNFGCIAEIDSFLRESAPLQAGACIGHIGEKPVYIIGLFKGKGNSYFGPAYGIRWNTDKADKARGFFNRGIACYMGRMPEWAMSLPRSK